MSKKYHVALSYAGEQREYVAKVADALKARGARVFYDEHEQTYLLGKDFRKVSHKIYGGTECDYVVVFASREYVAKPYPKMELQHALAGDMHKDREFVLVGKFDNVVLQGLPETTVYVDLNDKAPEEFTAMIVAKLSELGIRLDADEVTGEHDSVLSEEVKWRLRAAEQGDARAQHYLGMMYRAGLGVLQDYVAAVGWWQRAAKQGNADAQVNLGLSYVNGTGFPQDYAKAEKWWRRAAKQGNADAQHNLGVMHHNGEGVPQDYVEAVKWYRRAAKQGIEHAQNNLGNMYRAGDGVSQDYAKALECYRRAARRGFADAQTNLGNMYHAGDGVSQNHVKAVRWYRRAAKQGLAGAQYNLGLMHYHGNGVPQDHAEAVQWFQRAAEQGLAVAQSDLGIMHYNGNGVPQSYAEAVQWFERAGEQGIADAQYNLGIIYANGRGVPQDDAAAVKWWGCAAVQGDAAAQYNLGGMYARGEGVPQSYAEAVQWFERAGEQGIADAQYNLGIIYANGDGVSQDDAEAVRWYRRAAEQGYTEAQYNLGGMYARGKGVPKDYVRAYMWCNLAAAQEHETAKKNKAILAGQMTPEQIAEAERLAGEFVPRVEVDKSSKVGMAVQPAPLADAGDSGFAAPKRIFLCEGEPGPRGFDAVCYKAIFGSNHPNTRFVSAGSKANIENMLPAFQEANKGVEMLSLIDRDEKSDRELVEARRAGTRVLGRYALENYLVDDEVIVRFCEMQKHPEWAADLTAARNEKIVGDDFRYAKAKAAAVNIHNKVKQLGFANPGEAWQAFLRDYLAPFITPETQVYKELERDIFDS